MINTINVSNVSWLHFINTLIQKLDGTRAYQETDSDKMSVVNAHFNELPVKFSVCVNEGQENFPRCFGYLSYTKDHTKLDLLLILVLVLPLKFLNYYLPVLLLSNPMLYDTVRQCMKLQIKIGFGQ